MRAWWSLHRIVRGKPGSHPGEVKLPGVAHPLWLRPGTSDLAAFERIHFHGSLVGDSFPQHAALKARADALGSRAVVVDGGANIGLSAAWFATAYPKATIFAVEPDASNVELLRRNTAAYPNVVVVPGALWDRPAKLGIVNPEDSAWSFRVEEATVSSPTDVLPVCTINELMARANADELLIVKLIIQGAEKAVFRSNLDWLARTNLVIFMPNDWANPWSGAGHAAISAMSRLPFDWIVNDLCLFCYRDPASMAATSRANRAI